MRMDSHRKSAANAAHITENHRFSVIRNPAKQTSKEKNNFIVCYKLMFQQI